MRSRSGKWNLVLLGSEEHQAEIRSALPKVAPVISAVKNGFVTCFFPLFFFLCELAMDLCIQTGYAVLQTSPEPGSLEPSLRWRCSTSCFACEQQPVIARWLVIAWLWYSVVVFVVPAVVCVEKTRLLYIPVTL